MKKLIPWLGATVILIIIFGTMYGAVQQSLRRAANDPQIQIAEDTASSLNQGVKPTALTPGKVNLNTSLAPFVIIYDKSGHAISGSGYLNEQVPTIPYGVLRASDNKKYHFVTWQPQSSVRIATVTVAADKYYVLSGRSLKEIEINENQTFQIAFFGGIVALAVLGTVFVLSQKQLK